MGHDYRPSRYVTKKASNSINVIDRSHRTSLSATQAAENIRTAASVIDLACDGIRQSQQIWAIQGTGNALAYFKFRFLNGPLIWLPPFWQAAFRSLAIRTGFAYWPFVCRSLLACSY